LALWLAASGAVHAQADPPAATDTDSPVLRFVREVDAAEAGPTQPRWLPFPTRDDVRLGFDEPGLGLPSMVLRHPNTPGGATPGLRVWVPDPINTAFGERADGSFRLLMLDGSRDEVVEVEVSSARIASPPRVRGFSTASWGVTEPQGLAVDPATGEVFILDTTGRKIVRVVGDLGNGPHVSEIDLPRGLSGLRGIAVHPADGHLHLLSPSAQELYELDGAGRFLARRPLSAPGPIDPQLMTFAPSMDRAGAAARAHLFFAYAGPSGKTLVTEWTLRAPVEPKSPVRENHRNTKS
jgi:hypothetical protein